MSKNKASYIERALKSYFVDKFLGGFKLLFEKQLIPFSIVLFSVLGINILGMFLYSQEVSWMTLGLLKDLLLCGFLVAASIVVLGLASAVWKNYLFQLIFVFIGIILSVVYVFVFNPDTEMIGFEILKMVFLFAWVFISVTSIYFIIFYLFTGIQGKVMVAGKSDDHIFMGGLIRVVSFGTIVLSIMIIVNNLGSINAIVLGIMGLSVALILLIYGWTADLNSSTTNIISILGLFNFYITYQLSASINPSDTVKNVLTEILLFIFTALYYIQSKVSKVQSIGTDRLDKKRKGRKIFFQQKLVISALSKKIFGELALILMTIGLALGYSLLLLSIFIDPSLPLVDELSIFKIDIGIPLFSHRLFAFVAMLIFLISFISFISSENYRDFATNNYNFSTGVKILGDKVSSIGRRLKPKFGFGKLSKKMKDKEEKEEEEEL